MMVVKAIKTMTNKISNWLLNQPVVIRYGVGVLVIAADIVLVLLALVVIIPTILVATIHIEVDKRLSNRRKTKYETFADEIVAANHGQQK